ncbi:Fic family protein [Candidatus Babeliales bacterium]|nr:Fic family protein [Candidatus Babeliales bacterium]
MFKPIFSITPQIANCLINLEKLKLEIQNLPINPIILKSLRETARLQTIHYSTYIEGNRLTIEQVEELIKMGSAFPKDSNSEQKRDEKEILGYYAALEQVKTLSNINKPLTTQNLQFIHALVMGAGKTNIKPTSYRDTQNAIYDGATKKIVYLPPEAKDVPLLISNLIDWINFAEKENLPCPLRAAISHYQFTTIHPYFDGNGRTARIIATIILHRGGYDLKGLYSLEEYYAKNLNTYYEALSVGPSHNYYMGREESDITAWISYFCQGMIESFEKVKTYALIEYNKGHEDKSKTLRELDAQQQAFLSVFQKRKVITTKDIESFFGISTRSARNLCNKWSKTNFIVIKSTAKKSRTYELNPELDKKLF